MLNVAHVDDIGTIIRMTIIDQDGSIIDLSNASGLELIIKKGNNEIINKTAEIYTDGSDGIMKYTVISGDFDSPGLYSFQGKILTSSGIWYSSIDTKQIRPNLD